MNYRDIFLTLVYVILLIIMFSFIALILSSGEGEMKLSWAFYGFAIVTSVICILSILRSGRKKLVYWGMSSATIIMTILLVTSLILAKPTESVKIQIIAYMMLVLIVAINGISLYLLTQKSKMIEIPVDVAKKLNLVNKDNELSDSILQLSQPAPLTQPAQPSLSASTSSSDIQSSEYEPPPQQFQPPLPQQFQPPPPQQFQPPPQQFQQGGLERNNNFILPGPSNE